MDFLNYVFVACVLFYVISDLFKNKSSLEDRKLFFLAVFNGLFLLGISVIILIDESKLVDYWWLLIFFALPSFYYQYLRIKTSTEASSLKYVN